MKHTALLGSILVATLSTPSMLWGQAQETTLPKDGATVTLILPRAELGPPNLRLGLFYDVNVTQDASGVIVNGKPLSSMHGLPALIETRVAKPRKSKNELELTLAGRPEEIFLRFDTTRVTDPAAAFWQLVVPGGASDPPAIAKKNAAADPNLKGPLVDQAISIRAFGISIESYKGQQYVAVDLGPDTTVYNTLKLGPQARVARVISDRLLAAGKTFTSIMDQAKRTDAGVAFHVGVMSQNLVREFDTPTREDLVVYFPLDALRKFAAADITDQQLVDASVVIFAGNRIQPQLGAGG